MRERRSDNPLLAYDLMRKFAAAMDRPVREIAADALEAQEREHILRTLGMSGQ